MLVTRTNITDSLCMFEVDEKVDALKRQCTIQILGISKFEQPKKVSN